MTLRQLQVANDSIQDRLLLRAGTHENEEIRIWITRRFLLQLWPHLQTMAGRLQPSSTASPDLPEVPADAAPDAIAAVSEANETTGFEQAFIEDNPSFPLGQNPLLASEASLDLFEGKKLRLIFREGRERHYGMVLDRELLHVLCAMLRAAAQQAEWQLTLAYGKIAPDNTSGHEPPPSAPGHSGNLLH